MAASACIILPVNCEWKALKGFMLLDYNLCLFRQKVLSSWQNRVFFLPCQPAGCLWGQCDFLLFSFLHADGRLVAVVSPQENGIPIPVYEPIPFFPKYSGKTPAVCRVALAPWSSVDLIWRKLWRKCSCLEEWWEAPGSLLGQAVVLTGHYQNIASVSRFSLRLPLCALCLYKICGCGDSSINSHWFGENLDSQN